MCFAGINEMLTLSMCRQFKLFSNINGDFSSFSLFVPFPLLSVPPSFHPIFSLIFFPIYSQLTNESLMANGDGIPVELFQNLKDDAVKMLHSICQQIWKTQQWPQDWKRSVFIPVPRKVNTIEHSNCWTIALISHTSKVILKILQAKLQTIHESWTSRCSSWV